MAAGGFHLVVYHDMACIFAVDGHMDDGALLSAVVPADAHVVHHLAVADAHLPSLDGGLYAASGQFRNIADAASVGGLVGKGVP